jgi:uncharacterized protein YcsI (UPF0317 family)
MEREDLRHAHPQDIRRLIREGKWRQQTAGLAEGYVQANLAVVPEDLALQFFTFCQRNPRPCPVLEVTEPGMTDLTYLTQAVDLRTDLGKYRVFAQGECIAEPDNVVDYWRGDLVAFLLGCSLSFDWVLANAGIRAKWLEPGSTGCAYVSSIACQAAGIFHGPMVVSMRPVRRDQIVRAVQITSLYPAVHGPPVHIGDPAQIGILDLEKPDYGAPSPATRVDADEMPLFWGCGVTTQEVALHAKARLMITHLAGHMFISDRRIEDLAVL